MHASNRPFAIWPVSMARIESVVSAHLGPGRVPGNAQGPVLQPSGFHVFGEAHGPHRKSADFITAVTTTPSKKSKR